MSFLELNLGHELWITCRLNDYLPLKEQRKKNSATVSEGTLKQILLEIGDPNKVQQFLTRLVPGSAINLKASSETDVIQQAMEVLREWNTGPFDENPMVLLCRALEMSGCNSVDRTFFYGNYQIPTIMNLGVLQMKKTRRKYSFT